MAHQMGPAMRDVENSVMVLAPSNGLGGGIERYISSVVDGLDQLGVSAQRINVHEGSADRPLAKPAFVTASVAAALRREHTAIYVMHPNLFRLGQVLAMSTRRPWVGWAYGAEVFPRRDATRSV